MLYSKRNIIKVSYPIFLGLLAQNLINVTDTAFLGHVGEIELGASAIGGLYYICLFTLAFGFSVGAQILMARRNGEGNYSRIGQVLTQGTAFSMMMAAALLAISYFTARPFMSLMISSDTILEASVSFFSIRMWGLLFSFANTMFRAFYVAITRTKVLTINAIVMAAINIALDYALIFGKFGLPAMGLEGAALASVMAEAGSLLFFFIYTRYAVDYRKYGLTVSFTPDFRLIREILNVSVFMMLQQFIPLATWFVFFLAIEHLGQRELAIANVVRSIYILTLIPVQALSTTVNTIVSNAIGHGMTDKVMTIIRRTLKMSLILGTFCAVAMSMFPDTLLSIYTESADLIKDAIPSVYVIAAAIVIAAMSNVCFYSISGTGNTKAALFVEIAAQIIYLLFIIVSSWVLRWPVEACFTCEIVYYAILLAGSVIYLKFFNWRKAEI